MKTPPHRLMNEPLQTLGDRNGDTALSPEFFSRFRKILERETGILIPPGKERDIQFRLNPFLQPTADPEPFLQQISTSETFCQEVLNRITIGESYFFRNHPHFEALQHRILPDLLHQRRHDTTLRIWSAGCATGEEPYSLAILLDRYFPQLRQWDVRITATDINTEYLDRATTGSYGNWSFRGVDRELIRAYFTEDGPNPFTLRDAIRSRVTFRHLNLSRIPDAVPADLTNVDLILCRNVLIYFAHPLATRICQTFSDCLSNGGYLMLGHSESFPNVHNMETTYSHATFYYRHHISDKPSDESGAPCTRAVIPGVQLQPSRKPTPSKANPASPDHGSPAMRTFSAAPLPDLAKPGWTGKEQQMEQVRDAILSGDLTMASTVLTELRHNDGVLDHRICFLSALLADQMDDMDGALSALKQSIFLNKDFVIGHYYQAIISERIGDSALAKRGYRNTLRIAGQLPASAVLPEGGGINAVTLLEIASERLKELELLND